MPLAVRFDRSGGPITTRVATAADVDLLLGNVQVGFDSYVLFAPPGWSPPNVFADRDVTAERLASDETWGLVAFDGDDPAGHVAFFQARHRIERTVIPGLAHLWQLFVRPRWWGTGVAPVLHDGALAEMRARGFGCARLYTPSLHARARRFYERRGWQLTGEEFNENLALMLVEYRIAL